MNKLNKKLAEWAGFKAGASGCFTMGWFKFPDDSLNEELPSFTESLDACFKWLVPKLQKQWDSIDFIWDVGAWDIVLENYTSGKKFYLGKEYGETFEELPMAICKAMEKLIDNEPTKNQ